MTSKVLDPSTYPHLDGSTLRRDVHHLIDGAWEAGGATLDILHKYTGAVLGQVHVANDAQVDRAVQAAERAMITGPLPSHERSRILHDAADWLRQHQDVIGRLIAQESGKEIRKARGEVERTAHTLELSAEAGRAIGGEFVPMQGSPGFDNALAFTMRVPVGLVCAITPFNSPLNLVAHKVGPALAAGDAVIIKPTELAPTPAAFLGQALIAAGLRAGWMQILNGPGEGVGQRLLEHPAFAMYSFTGSRAIGEHIKRTVGLRKVALELGNNSATIVHRDADVDEAAEICARQAFANSGQVCISVQRIYVHEDVRERFLDRMLDVTRSLVVGNPEDEGVDVGPMIAPRFADRAEELIRDAVDGGGRLLFGGTRTGNVVEPTILVDPPSRSRIICEEAFSPIAAVVGYSDLADVFRAINESEYGLQSGIFTSDIETAFHAARALRMGGVIVNGSSRYRADVMPYGGVKASGEGREGPKYAVEDMTEPRLVVFNLKTSPYPAVAADSTERNTP